MTESRTGSTHVFRQDIAFSGDGPADPAIWFRLWIDDQGLVRQTETRAIGHFMDHRYYDFDAPITIAPPTGPGATG